MVERHWSKFPSRLLVGACFNPVSGLDPEDGARRADFRTFLGEFIAASTHVELASGLSLLRVYSFGKDHMTIPVMGLSQLTASTAAELDHTYGTCYTYYTCNMGARVGEGLWREPRETGNKM
jgi:hypothetical protein